jgi:hypothetical protein
MNTCSLPTNDNDIDGIYKYLAWCMRNNGMGSDCFHYLEVLKCRADSQQATFAWDALPGSKQTCKIK